MATHSCILAWRIPIDRGAWGLTSPWGRRVRRDQAHASSPALQSLFRGSFSQLNTFEQRRSLPSSPPPPSPPCCLVQVYQKCLCCVFLPLLSQTLHSSPNTPTSLEPQAFCSQVPSSPHPTPEKRCSSHPISDPVSPISSSTRASAKKSGYVAR